MVVHLKARFGEKGAAGLLGVPVVTLRGWCAGKRIEAAPARAVWLVHALLLRPGIVTSAFDLVTWGRFHVVRRAVRRAGSEWSDWCI